MGLIERLEKRARELDQQVRAHGMSNYGQDCADERELLLEAAAALRSLTPRPIEQVVSDFSDRMLLAADKIGYINTPAGKAAVAVEMKRRGLT